MKRNKKNAMKFNDTKKLVLSILFMCHTIILSWAQSESKFSIPSDKKLSTDWLSSLSTRGNPEIWEISCFTLECW